MPFVKVHRAQLFNGDEVVVKVKYPNIESQFEYDMITIENFCKLAQPEQVRKRIFLAQPCLSIFVHLANLLNMQSLR